MNLSPSIHSSSCCEWFKVKEWVTPFKKPLISCDRLIPAPKDALPIPQML